MRRCTSCRMRCARHRRRTLRSPSCSARHWQPCRRRQRRSGCGTRRAIGCASLRRAAGARPSSGAQIARGEGITGRVFVTAEAHVEPDILRNPGLAEGAPIAYACGLGCRLGADPHVGRNRRRVICGAAAAEEVTPEQSRLLVSLAEIAGSIIQRLQLLQQTQAQAELTRQIVNTVPEGLALMTGSGRILLANAAGESLLRELGSMSARRYGYGRSGSALYPRSLRRQRAGRSSRMEAAPSS